MQHERCEEYTMADLAVIEREAWCARCGRNTTHSGECGSCIQCQKTNGQEKNEPGI